MSPVCFVTERLFPVGSIDDWAIELSWRARALAQAKTPVVILWSILANIPAAHLERARQYYAAAGVELVVKEDLAPFLAPDEPLHCSSGGKSGLLAFGALRKLHEKRRFGRIEVPAERGLAFRIVQAQRAGLAFTDTDLIVVLGNFGEWQRHHQMRLAIHPEEIKQDFMERESVELAQCVVTAQSQKVAFANELGWETARIQTRPLAQLPPANTRDIRTRNVPCYFGDPDEEPGFEAFRTLIEKTSVFPRWLFVEESRSEPGTLKRQRLLEAAAKNSRSQVEFLSNPEWETFATVLEEKSAFVILNQSAPGPRLQWLLNESIPFVFAESLVITLPENERQKAAGLAFLVSDPRTLLASLKCARGYSNWPHLLAAWRQCLSPVEPPAVTHTIQVSVAEPPPAAATPPIPRVTIAVSHYNLKHLLGETLECLEAQTYSACDVVVVDDGSDDPESLHAWQECKKRHPAFSFIELPHRGYWSPRNHAIHHCTNPYIIIVDGDNLPRPDMAEIFVRAMRRNPEFAAFTSYIAAFSEERQAALRGEFQALNTPLGGDLISGYFQNIFGDTNSIFRTEALQAIGGFRENFRCAFGDWELFHRLVGRGHRLGVVPRVLLHYRRRAGGMIRQRTLYREHWEFLPALEAPTEVRPADRRRLGFALHGLALGK